MKQINIFLASSIDELKSDRQEIGNFIRKLNDIYMPDIYFRLYMCEDESDVMAKMRKQEEYNNMVRKSQFFFVIFYTKVGEYTVEEFNIALNEFKEKNSPRIITYFKALMPDENPTEDIKNFMNWLDKELGHYYNMYSSIDTVKLSMMLEMARDKALNINLELKDSILSSNGNDLISLENIPLYKNNETLNNLLKLKKELDEEFFKNINKASTDEKARENILDISLKLNNTNNEIHKIEMNILDLTSKVVEYTSMGMPVTERLKETLRCFEKGDYNGAKAILDSKERELEAERDNEISEKTNERHLAYIEENLLLIKLLMAEGLSKENEEKIIDLYKKSVAKEEKFNLPKKSLSAYAGFLLSIKEYDESKRLYERLLHYYDLEDTPSAFEKKLVVKNNLATIYDDTNKHDLAEQLLLEIKDDFLTLSKENLKNYNFPLCFCYNNLANIYTDTKRYDQAEKIYLEALDICQNIDNAGKDALTSDIYYNLARLYFITMSLDKAEENYLKSLEIRLEMTRKHPKMLRFKLSATYSNLATCYKLKDDTKNAEKYFLEAMKIKEQLAKENPFLYQSGLLGVYNSISDIYIESLRLEDAEKYLQKAINVCTMPLKDHFEQPPMTVELCYRLAEIYKKTGKTVRLEKILLKSLELIDILDKNKLYNLSKLKADIYHEIAKLHKGKKNFNDAEKFYKKALDIRKNADKTNYEVYQKDLATSYNDFGNFYLITHQPEKAQEYLTEGMRILKKISKTKPFLYEPLLAMSYFNLANTYMVQQKIINASTYIIKARDIAKKYKDIDETCKKIYDILK